MSRLPDAARYELPPTLALRWSEKGRLTLAFWWHPQHACWAAKPDVTSRLLRVACLWCGGGGVCCHVVESGAFRRATFPCGARSHLEAGESTSQRPARSSCVNNEAEEMPNQEIARKHTSDGTRFLSTTFGNAYIQQRMMVVTSHQKDLRGLLM